MHPIILIPSRLQSTRLPEKPLADIVGKPMIQHMIERALAANAGRVVVATDSKRIASIVSSAGGEAVMTDADCPSGSDRIWQALLLIDSEAKHDVVINLQGDMPTFKSEILTQVLGPLKDESIDIATLVAPIHNEDEKYNPAVVKALLSAKAGIHGYQAITFTRESKPSDDGNFYHHVGIYAYRREALQRFVSMPPSENEQREKLEQLRALDAGMKIGVCIIDEAPIGVDTPETLEMARAMLI
jgi:3-deoxy-manno-octulosonate cytidylyltransferase (CMP-KDO synthetase)